MQDHPILDRLVLRIVAATNASPIEIETDAVHGLTTGDTPTVEGVGGNTNANGAARPITVVSTTKFTIDDTAGNAAHLPQDSGQVLVDQTETVWAAINSLTGTPRTFNKAKHDDKVHVIVSAENDPSTGGASTDVIIELWGRAGAGGWTLLGTTDNGKTWVVDPDGIFVAIGLSLQVWPEMRLDIKASATSTNTVRAWLVG